MERELLVSIWNRPQAILWIKRSGRYMPHIEKVLKENGMPDDLKYIAVAESALLPHIGSHKHAIGFWQFIKPTGLQYGLRIDGSVDERRNIFTSTRAAVAYLKKLHKEFGSWTLAAAAYNMGERRLRREIVHQRTKSYYHLYIPLETQRYIFKILAIKLILSDPKKYGFHLRKQDLYPPLSFDRVQIKASDSIPLQLIAQAASTHFKKIKDLNPELRRTALPRGTRYVLISKGSAKGFHSRLAPLVKKYQANRPKRTTYVVKGGDHLSGIAKRHGVKVSDLRRWNHLKNKQHIYPGQRLVVKK